VDLHAEEGDCGEDDWTELNRAKKRERKIIKEKVGFGIMNL
jgi:hypothetical protein